MSYFAQPAKDIIAITYEKLFFAASVGEQIFLQFDNDLESLPHRLCPLGYHSGELFTIFTV